MTERSLRVVAMLFPGVTQLDLTASVQFLHAVSDATVDLVWHAIEPVPTDSGFAIVPTTTFADSPAADVLLVPGGQGAFDLLDDERAMEFVRRSAEGAIVVVSVCTGAFVLGAAGLLRGRRATTHWSSRAMLPMLGAELADGRVVRDGPIITGGGVTAGIDVALAVIASLRGDAEARRIQLAYEYDPAPPFDAGHPDAPQANPAQVTATIAAATSRRTPAVARAAARLARR